MRSLGGNPANCQDFRRTLARQKTLRSALHKPEAIEARRPSEYPPFTVAACPCRRTTVRRCEPDPTSPGHVLGFRGGHPPRSQADPGRRIGGSRPETLDIDRRDRTVPTPKSTRPARTDRRIEK